MYRQPTSKRAATGSGAAARKRGISTSSTSSTNAPSVAYPEYGSPRARAVHSAHDCSATPHCSSPPPLVIESPSASTPMRQGSVAMTAAEASSGSANLERRVLDARVARVAREADAEAVRAAPEALAECRAA